MRALSVSHDNDGHGVSKPRSGGLRVSGSLFYYHFAPKWLSFILAYIDYSTINEIARMEELSVYSYEDICTAVHGLKNWGFLLEVKKPYGYVYMSANTFYRRVREYEIRNGITEQTSD